LRFKNKNISDEELAGRFRFAVGSRWVPPSNQWPVFETLTGADDHKLE
jgi:hypothetical protein